MYIRQTNRLVIAVYLALTVVNILAFSAFSHFRQLQDRALARQATATIQAERLVAGAKLLSGSVRAFAATGDAQHEKAYRDEMKLGKDRNPAEPVLRALGLTADELGLIEQARANADTLIELDERAFKEGRAGKRDRAIALVFGDDYQKALAAIHKPVEKFQAGLGARMAAEVAAARATATAFWALSLGLAGVNAVLVAAIFGLFYRRRVILPLVAMNQQVQSVLAGKNHERLGFVEESSEIGELARSIDVYRDTAGKVADDQWIKAHQARIGAALQGVPGYLELAQRFLNEIAPLLEAGHGVFYIHEEDRRRLRLLAHYAYTERKTLSQWFALGEGLVGQCAMEKSPIILHEPPADYVRISSTLGEAVPVAILAQPVLSGEHVLGVVELATFRAFAPREKALLDGLMPVLAMAMEILERSVKAQRLLEETQQQARRMEEQAAQLAQQTDELEAQQQILSHTLEEQTAIFASVSSGIAVIAQGQIVKANRQLERIFLADPDALVGTTTRGWYANAASFDSVEAVAAAILRGETARLEVAMVRRSGEAFWGRLTGRVIDAAQPEQGVVWTLEDVSDERATAAAMRRAKEMAEEAARTKSDFLANMSHEIRTPMNAVIGMSHLALKTGLNPRQRDYIKKIQQSGQHLLGIINDILDFSKIEAGKLTVEQTNFELNKVLDNVANLIGEKAGAKGLELLFDIAADVPDALVGDPLRLGQILINYCNNAVKFTEAGEIHIVVRKIEEGEGDVLLRFGVRDTGIGLTAEQMGRLFRSFSQADTSTSRKYGGTGLGLAISKNLAELMGGQVGVESAVGEGSTFWFTARLGKGAARRSLLPSPDLRGRRVLVVDDNESARAVLADMLGGMSFVVETVAGGAAAVAAVAAAAAAQQPFEVVFLDWQMPGMDGIEAAVRIRQLGLDPTPHLMMVTAYGREEVIKSAETAGIEDVLIKPVNPSLLFDSLMRRYGVQDEERATNERGGDGADLSAIAGARVLLVEDNDMNQQVACELLAEAGFVVDIAEDGKIALDMVAAGDYDIVLMDMQMPVMDGVTATLEIRKLAQFAALPIVAMTANAMPQDRERCIAAGMNDHVAKPIDPDELWQTLLKWIAPQGNATAAMPAKVGAGGTAPPPLAPAADLPRHIPGLDVDLGLKRALGKHPLYLSLLRKFVAGQQRFAEQMAAALDADDWGTAERLAHTLKGTAGNIGATELQMEAGKLETALRERQERDVVDDRLSMPATLLAALVAALEAALPPLPGAAPAGAVDLAQLGPLVARLLDFIADDNPEAAAFWGEHAGVFRAAFPGHWQDIDDCLRNFDLEDAMQLLRSAAKERGLENA